MRLYQNILLEFREMYYTYATLGIVASSCLGSVAAMLILMNGFGYIDMIHLFMIVAVAMWYNATVLAQLKAKFVFNSLLISLITSLFFIIYHLI